MMTMLQDFILLTAVSAALLTVLQAATYLVGRQIGRYNVVDVSWGLGFVAVAAAAALLGHGDPVRRAVLVALVSVWGLRLSWHMHKKSAGKGEDPRYLDLLDRAGGGGARQVVVRIFLTQGAAQWFVSLPLQLSAALGPTPVLIRPVFALGFALWVIGVAFEAVGDDQLRRFKANPAHRGLVMDRGLWAWTRHPNYFGDACVWWGLWLISLTGLIGLSTVLAPVLMTYFLVHATGARLLETYLAGRPGYREYQQRTAFFVPRPPRRGRE